LTRDETISDKKNDIVQFVVESMRSGRFEHKNGREIEGEMCSKIVEAYDHIQEHGKDGVFMFNIHYFETYRIKGGTAVDKKTCNKETAEDINRAFESGEAKEFATAKRTDIKSDEIDIWVPKRGKKQIDFDHNTIFVTSHVFPSLTDAIPITNHKEVFISKLPDGTETISNGALVIPFPVETCESIESMKTNLDKSIETCRRLKRPGQVSRIDKPIVVSTAVWNAIQTHGEIHTFLKEKYGVSLKCSITYKTFTKQQKLGYITLNSISW
jgi:hypothetical protein